MRTDSAFASGNVAKIQSRVFRSISVAIAEITYQYQDDHTILADHTWVDLTLRGQGVARQLLDILVAFAREKQLKIVPVCSYVETVFETDTQYADVVA
nr:MULTISPECIES: GNAT family N-acetyltransferase [unclassified Acinetobacter]